MCVQSRILSVRVGSWPHMDIGKSGADNGSEAISSRKNPHAAGERKDLLRASMSEFSSDSVRVYSMCERGDDDGRDDVAVLTVL